MDRLNGYSMRQQPREGQKIDAEVVAAVKKGERAAFELIVRSFQPELLRAAYNQLGRIEHAEEVVQETFVSVFKSIDTYDLRYSFRTWIWTILINQCRQRYKRLKRLPKTDGGIQSSDAQSEWNLAECRSGDPQQAAQKNERNEQLRRILNELPEVQATALRLRFFGSLKFQEIADSMGCSLSSAKNRVKLGLQALSQVLTNSDLIVGENER